MLRVTNAVRSRANEFQAEMLRDFIDLGAGVYVKEQDTKVKSVKRAYRVETSDDGTWVLFRGFQVEDYIEYGETVMYNVYNQKPDIRTFLRG